MAFTARLHPDLEAEAKAYAGALGVPLSALLAISLRDYLDRRGGHSLPSASAVIPRRGRPPKDPAKAAAPLVVSAAGQPVATLPTLPARVYRKPPSVSDPCPCGAMDRLGYYPLKWKHCHGRKAPA